MAKALLNLIELDGVKSNDPKLVAKKLVEIEEKSRTHGTSQPIGKLYGFDLLVKTEASMKDGFDFIENRFFVRGEGNILYNLNGGRLAKEPNIAAQMFLRTFETVPPLLEKYQKEVEQISKDIPILQEVVKETWKKEDQLKQLKSDLAALDRKIQLSLKPVKQNEDSNSKDESQSNSDSQSQGTNATAGTTQPLLATIQPPTSGAPSASPTTSPSSDGRPYVHHSPDFLSTPPEKKPPHLSQPPVSFSIKDTMNSLGSKLVIGDIPKPGNKDDPDTAHTNKPKGFKL